MCVWEGGDTPCLFSFLLPFINRSCREIGRCLILEISICLFLSSVNSQSRSPQLKTPAVGYKKPLHTLRKENRVIVKDVTSTQRKQEPPSKQNSSLFLETLLSFGPLHISKTSLSGDPGSHCHPC